jgi:diguanylate cyclase (GGDEF)-like protein
MPSFEPSHSFQLKTLMSNLDTPNLLRSLAKLIEKPEIKALEFSLIKTLDALITAESVRLYEVRTLKQADAPEAEAYLLALGAENDEDAASMPVALKDNPGFEECYRTGVRVTVSGGDAAKPLQRFIYPIAGLKGITGFLVIDCVEYVVREHELVGILLEFYRNYISLLDDNQRDHLTGLLNRKSFDDKVMRIILSLSEVNKRNTDKVNYCLAVFDIDHFKRVNDTHGHLMGDEVLLHFSQCMNQTFREYDLLFRVGGEEFVVVLRNVDVATAAMVFERFRKLVESHYFPQVGQITTSIGVTVIGPADLPVTAMDRADQALYHAKENGRNRVGFFEQLVAEGKLQKKSGESDIEMF